MEIVVKKREGIFALLVILLVSVHVLADESSQEKQTAAVKEEITAPVAPDLSEVIPMAAELSGRLAALENNVRSKLDLALFEKKHAEIITNINTHARELQMLRDSGDYRATKLIVLRQKIEKENNVYCKR